MLDTIKLNAEGFHAEALKPHEDWQLITSSDGELVRQQATVFLNTAKGEKDRLLYNGTVRFDYCHKKQFLNIGLSSAPALLYGTSFTVLQRKDLTRLHSELQKHTDSFADCDISSAKVTRLDNSTIYDMNAPAGKYICLLDSISRNRQQHTQKKYFEGETIEFYNRQRTVGFYDKYAKNIKNEVERQHLADTNAKANALRFEVQNKRAKSIRHAFGLTENLTLKQLDSDYIQASLYKQRVKEFHKHFKYVIGEKKVTLQDFFNTSIFMKAQHKRTALDKTLWLLALEKNFISLSELKAVMYAAGYSRQAVYRRMTAMKELLQYDISKADLYAELKAKIEIEAA